MNNETTAAAHWIDKKEAAVRLLRVAIRLFYERCDAIALHTLVSSAHGIVADLARNTGAPSSIGSEIEFVGTFLRQAKEDSQVKINIEPLPMMTEDLIFDCVKTLQGIVPDLPFEAKTYWGWFMCTRPDQFQGIGPAVDSIVQDAQHLATMSFGDIRQMLRFNQALDVSETFPDWALLGPGSFNGKPMEQNVGTPLPSKGDDEKSGQPSTEYLEKVKEFDLLLRKCADLSNDCAGILAPTNSHYWASVLFTTICTRAASFARVVPFSAWCPSRFIHWDYASAASLTRSLLEIRLAFFYLCIESCSDDEWLCRWNIFNVHDCTARIQMFTDLEPAYDCTGFRTQLNELQDRLYANPFFQSLNERVRRRCLSGQMAYLDSLETIAERSGVSLSQFRWLYRFLSIHVHGYPMSYYRMQDGERGRGVHSKIEENYTQLFLTFVVDFISRAHDEMKRKFPKFVAEGHG